MSNEHFDHMKTICLTLGLAAATAAWADPVGCPDFAVDLPRAKKGALVLAKDFGFSTATSNNAAAITAAYKTAYGDEPTCAVIKPSEGAHLV